MRNVIGVVSTLATACLACECQAQLVELSSFQISSGRVSLGFDPASSTVYSYGSFGAVIERYSTAGAFLGTLPRPGGSANDVDLEVAHAAFVLGTTPVPPGTVLFIDGESGTAEIYAVNPVTGILLGSLTTSFGVSHVVGGGYHAGRGTFFLVQDRVPGASDENRIAEINTVTGAIINSFQITAVAPTFTVNFGDLDVGPNGNLFVVTDDETSIGEFTPIGGFVQLHALPPNAGGLSGIGIDDSSCEAWIGATSGRVTRLGGLFPLGACVVTPLCDPDVTCDGNSDQDDVACLIAAIAGNPGCECQDPDFNRDGNVDQDDVAALINVIAGGPCP